MNRVLLALLFAVIGAAQAADPATPPLPNPIAFVAQMPPMQGYPSLNDVFTNHRGPVKSAPRGSDLYILYPSGDLKNLTQAAGYGCQQPICSSPGNTTDPGYPTALDPQGQLGGIAVRDPQPHWNGQKLIFSMLIGAPRRFQTFDYRWQLFEITGLGANDTPVVTKVASQPPYNNVQPAYLSDGRIVFASDRPRGGQPHLYPQHDEYESLPIVTGLYALDPTNATLTMLTHAPSGDFHPSVLQDGRVVFNRWDHLIRDQQADADWFNGTADGTFTYSSEAANASRMTLSPFHEVFPEPRQTAYINALYPGSPMVAHAMNFFMPWQIRQDGTELETVNHLGRHELLGFFERPYNDDPALVSFNFQAPLRPNQNATDNLHALRELPTEPGRLIGVRTIEFGARGAGQLLYLDAVGSAQSANAMRTRPVTHPDTFGFNPDNQPPKPNDSGKYRDPTPLSDGRLLAAHSPETRVEQTASNSSTEVINGQTVSVWRPSNRYGFRLRLLSGNNGDLRANGPFLTGAGIRKTTAMWGPDELIRYENVLLWETDAVEVRLQSAPPNTSAPPLAAPEASVFANQQVNVADFRNWLQVRGLGVIVVRNVTQRDAADRQQPFNLRVPGGTQTLSPQPPGARIYDVDKLEVFQADQVRGKGGIANPAAGRRVIARALHDSPFTDLQLAGFPGSYAVAPDGSAAVVVPAARALAWQTLAPNGTPVVRERVWVSLQPGEIRACEGCHGLNALDQAGNPPASNPPQALAALLQHWKINSDALLRDGFE